MSEADAVYAISKTMADASLTHASMSVTCSLRTRTHRPVAISCGRVQQQGMSEGHRISEKESLLQAAFGTNELPLPPGSSREDGPERAAEDPSTGTLCPLRKVTGSVFK